MDFEKVIKYISDTYTKDCPIKKEKGICKICNCYFEILEKFDFILNFKKWDYDD